MSVTVKICGITSQADARAAAAAEADAIGLMFYKESPRHVTIEQAKEICEVLPAHIMRVGVFVNTDEALINRALSECLLNILQFHGDETPEDCAQYPVMTLKAFRVQGPETLEQMKDYSTAGFLLDAYTKEARGGTGEKFNWDLAVQAQQLRKPVFLAGGLTPDNVAEAVRKVEPFGVDVSSGVESEPGKKDSEKMVAFVKAAKSALT
ncbi:MAG: phosphoribosylanthranilate isomerase [Verrucomicrobiota bacterium]|nr:phosphoribosylanthranilate isomerase [Verrucomicrobiota bacterium]